MTFFREASITLELPIPTLLNMARLKAWAIFKVDGDIVASAREFTSI